MRPTIIEPGGEDVIGFRALNAGDTPTNAGRSPSAVTISATLPSGMKVKSMNLFKLPEVALGSENCSEPSPGQVQCTYPASSPELNPFEYIEMSVTVKAEGGSGGLSTAQVTGGEAAPVSVKRELSVGEGSPSFGVEDFSIVPEEEGGAVDAQAGSHPFQLTTTFALNQNLDPLHPPALPKSLEFNLSPGLVANAVAFPRCGELAFLTKTTTTGGYGNQCPADTAVGVVMTTVDEPNFGGLKTYPIPVFNLTPKQGEPVRFGFYFIGIPVPIDFSLRTGGDYGATASVANITQIANFLSESLTIWGVPGEAVHNASRGWSCLANELYANQGATCNPSSQSQPPPFLTLPTSCATPFAANVEGSSWPLKASPGAEPKSIALPRREYTLQDSFGQTVALTGCNDLPFNPFIEVAPDVQQASTSTGLSVHVRVPQEVSENAGGLASSSVKDITVALPEGVLVNPAGGNGLEACPEGLIGFSGFNEFNPGTEPGNKTTLFTPTLGGGRFVLTAAKVATVKIVVPGARTPIGRRGVSR